MCGSVQDSSFFSRKFDGVLAWGLLFLLLPEAQRSPIRSLADILVPGGRLLFTSPAEPIVWLDLMTGLESRSLGAPAYRRLLAAASISVNREYEDEGRNHYKDVIEGQYGLPMSAPLIHLREYVGLVRSLLWEGHASHQGRFYTVAATLPEAPKTPLLLSALGPAAFRLAGALSDGAISWMAPMPCLLDVALPNLQAGADEARRPQPPLIAHVPVALSDDPAAVRAAAQGALDYFRTLPAYVSMFTAAGLFDGPEEEAAARLATMLIVAGDEAAVS